jgi:hypothetical protein
MTTMVSRYEAMGQAVSSCQVTSEARWSVYALAHASSEYQIYCIRTGESRNTSAGASKSGLWTA